MWNFVHAERLSFKTVVASERDRDPTSRKRRRVQWNETAGEAGSILERLVFIDETWTKTNMGLLRGCGDAGRKASWSRFLMAHWKTLTFLAALRRVG